MSRQPDSTGEKDPQNGPLQFFIGLVLLAAGLFWLSQSVMVQTSWFTWRLGGMQLSSGLSVVPLIIGIVWLFFNPKSRMAKLVTVLGGVLIIAALILSIDFHFVRTSLFSFILMIGFIAAGSGLLLRTLFKKQK